MSKRTLSRRDFLRASAATAAGVALAACTPAPAPEPTPKPAEPKPTTAPAAPEKVVVEFWGASSTNFQEAMDANKQKWLDQSGVEINYIRAPTGWGNQYERVNAAIAAGSPPGLVHLKDFNMWDYAWRDAVLPLDDYFSGSSVPVDELRTTIWDAQHFDDKVYGAPWKGSFIWALYGNDTMFEEAGLDPQADFPTTWDELADVAAKMTDEGAGKYGHSFYDLGTNEPNLMLFSAYVGQAGGEIFNADRTRVTLDTPEAAEALQYMVDMVWTKKVALPPEQMAERWDLVYSGVIGTWLTGAWFMKGALANAPELKFSLHSMQCHKTCDNVDTPETMVILKGVKDPDASWRAIEVLCQPDVDLEMSLAEGFTPAFYDNLDKMVDAAPSNHDNWAAYVESAKSEELRPRQWAPGYDDAVSVITPELQAAWFNQKSVKDALVAAEKAGNEALDRA